MPDISKLSFCRVAWDISGYGQGHGDWFDVSEEPSLQDLVKTFNQEYGAGSHRIEYDDGTSSYDIAQEQILKAVELARG